MVWHGHELFHFRVLWSDYAIKHLDSYLSPKWFQFRTSSSKVLGEITYAKRFFCRIANCSRKNVNLKLVCGNKNVNLNIYLRLRRYQDSLRYQRKEDGVVPVHWAITRCSPCSLRDDEASIPDSKRTVICSIPFVWVKGTCRQSKTKGICDTNQVVKIQSLGVQW